MTLSLMLVLLGPIPVPPPIFSACNVPAGVCDTLEIDCVAAGIEPVRCMELAQAVCPGDRCLACDRTLDACEAVGGECEALAEHCEQALRGCNCERSSCLATTSLSMPQLFAACFAWPLSLDCETAPDVGQCFTTITWQGCAGLTTCEYYECMEAIEQQAACGETPAACVEVAACVASEATP